MNDRVVNDGENDNDESISERMNASRNKLAENKEAEEKPRKKQKLPFRYLNLVLVGGAKEDSLRQFLDTHKLLE